MYIYALNVCWKCRRATGKGFQLFRVGKYDYVCKDCKDKGSYLPEDPNTSKLIIPHLTKEQREHISLSEIAAQPREIINKEGNTTVEKVAEQ